MQAIIAIIFGFLYFLLASFLAILGSAHGPALFPYFVFGYLCITEAALAWLYFLVRRRARKHNILILLLGAASLGICLFAASAVSVSPLNNWEFLRAEREAAATQVLNMRDEILLSPRGNPIGMRLRYSIRFPRRGYFWQSPTLTPDTNLAVSVWADGRLSDQKVGPVMPLSKLGVPQYDAQTTYNFVTEFVPNFLMWNADKTRLCVLAPPPEYQATFDDLLNGPPVHYKIGISGTEYHGLTQDLYDLKSFQQGAKKEGATQLQGVGFGGSVGPCN